MGKDVFVYKSNLGLKDKHSYIALEDISVITLDNPLYEGSYASIDITLHSGATQRLVYKIDTPESRQAYDQAKDYLLSKFTGQPYISSDTTKENDEWLV